MAESPWSVKGVERRAREAAKQAARAEGRTLGVWLSDRILNAWSAESSPAGPAEWDALEARLAHQESLLRAFARDVLAGFAVLRSETRTAQALAERRGAADEPSERTAAALESLADRLDALARPRPALPAPSAPPPPDDAPDWDHVRERLQALEEAVELLQVRATTPSAFGFGEPEPPRRGGGAAVAAAAFGAAGALIIAVAAYWRYVGW